MALADYYRRGALAAAQVLDGFDEALFRDRLEASPVGLALDETTDTFEGRVLAELLTRLLARLYPRLALLGPERTTSRLITTAKAINPNLELTSEAGVGVSIGKAMRPFPTTFYAGSAGWDALHSTSHAQPVGDSDNPVGASVAACLAASNVFRRIFVDDWEQQADHAVRFSAWALDRVDQPTNRSSSRCEIADDAVLAGIGAVGNACLWVLARAAVEGRLHLVDPQDIELSNIQRYVLTERSDEGRTKVDLAASLETSGLTLVPHRASLAEFVATHGYRWAYFLLGLDSIRDRRTAQGVLPKWIANAWTQPGDLGVSTHPFFGGEGACVACLYLPTSALPNEDEQVAATLGVPERRMEVRTLLYSGAPLEQGFLDAVASAIGRPTEMLLPFEGRSIRELYVEGFCGGAVIPLGEAGSPPQELHVPLAHQSTLAGVLLAASFIRACLGGDPPITTATRLNVLRAVGTQLAQPIRAARDGRCLCDDAVFRSRYTAKYRTTRPPTG